tara:strand:+ start:601 stop:1038 length:438 start_codon:yes stop_codon:yes gene_type:complete
MGRQSDSDANSEAERQAAHDLYGDDSDEEEMGPRREAPPRCHVRHMPGFQENFLGGIPSDPPEFFQVPGHGWSSFGGIYNEPDPDGNLVSFRPVRSMCFNVPIECWSSDATRFNHWATPKMNSARAANIAALLGLIYTPLSKGWL